MLDNPRINQLKELLQEDPSDSFVLFAIAKEYDKMLEYQLAIEYFEKLRALNPAYVGLYYHLAHVYIEVDDSEKALEIFDLGIKCASTIKNQHALSELQNAKLNFEMGL